MHVFQVMIKMWENHIFTSHGQNPTSHDNNTLSAFCQRLTRQPRCTGWTDISPPVYYPVQLPWQQPPWQPAPSPLSGDGRERRTEGPQRASCTPPLSFSPPNSFLAFRLLCPSLPSSSPFFLKKIWSVTSKVHGSEYYQAAERLSCQFPPLWICQWQRCLQRQKGTSLGQEESVFGLHARIERKNEPSCSMFSLLLLSAKLGWFNCWNVNCWTMWMMDCGMRQAEIFRDVQKVFQREGEATTEGGSALGVSRGWPRRATLSRAEDSAWICV